ncbi:MAG: hypothetical protein H7258_07915 [Ferruginibacter sp.]|nr:hypothetical protein [Ferruginibacter sp.]
MKITFNKNVQFTRLIKIGGRLREFNFRKANTTNKGLFTVDVLDDEGPQGNRIIFYMEYKETEWQIQPQKLPSWVQGTEKQLDKIISEALEKELL